MLVSHVKRRIAAVLLTVPATVLGVLAGPGSAAATGFSCSGSGSPVYAVVAGDGWFAIAERVGVSPSQLLAANDADADDTLMPGDTLCLPDGATPVRSCAGATRTVAAGDSWSAIAASAGVSIRALLQANGATPDWAIHPGDELCLPASAGNGSDGSTPKGASYAVVAGDSWFGIAQRAGVTLRALLDVNDASSSSLLMPGDSIVLPAGARRPSAVSVQLAAAPVRARCWYADTWQAPRGGGRRHMGVDIVAASGSKVYAVAGGVLTKRAWDQPGKRAGNAWTLTTSNGTSFFYAHLLDFAPGLEVGSRVAAGDVIGFVGSTGDTTVSHLHLEVRPGGGSPVNPYPIVRAVSDCGQAING
jgi:murein DD-endopeptidase MepM/ murein hydrolase activator NlpD